jgi:hypothetical protein
MYKNGFADAFCLEVDDKATTEVIELELKVQRFCSSIFYFLLDFLPLMMLPKSYGIVMAMLLVIILVVHECTGNTDKPAKRDRKCRFVTKKDKCVDIIPAKVRKNKHMLKQQCPGFNIRQHGKCGQIGGVCLLQESNRGKKICECITGNRLF